MDESRCYDETNIENYQASKIFLSTFYHYEKNPRWDNIFNL